MENQWLAKHENLYFTKIEKRAEPQLSASTDTHVDMYLQLRFLKSQQILSRFVKPQLLIFCGDGPPTHCYSPSRAGFARDAQGVCVAEREATAASLARDRGASA